jgi:hypothetical protein
MSPMTTENTDINMNDAILGLLQAAETGIDYDFNGDNNPLRDIFHVNDDEIWSFDTAVETDHYGNSRLTVCVNDYHFEITVKHIS